MDPGFLTEQKRVIQSRLDNRIYCYEDFWKKTHRELVLIGPSAADALNIKVNMEPWPWRFYRPSREFVICDSDKVNYSSAQSIEAPRQSKLIFPLDRPWNCLDPEDWTQALEVNHTGFSTNPLTGFDLDFCKPLRDEDTVNDIAHLIYCTGTSPCWVRVTNSVGRVNTIEEHNFYTDMLIRMLTNDDLSQLLYLEKVSYLGGHSNTYPMRVLQVIIENKRVKEVSND